MNKIIMTVCVCGMIGLAFNAKAELTVPQIAKSCTDTGKLKPDEAENTLNLGKAAKRETQCLAGLLVKISENTYGGDMPDQERGAFRMKIKKFVEILTSSMMDVMLDMAFYLKDK